MTQADLQRDVEILCELRTKNRHVPASAEATLDRAIATARVLASMSDEQRRDVAEQSVTIATLPTVMPALADAHRKVARLMGDET